tara:strand:+ start:66 stop:731 length:666 start_codon:yes stop_codon:yes gene_type:complete
MDVINYVHFVNDRLISPFAPSWNYFIGQKIVSSIDCNRLKNYLLKKESEILDIKHNLDDGGTGLGNDSTVSRYKHYNVFLWDQLDINILYQEIVMMYNNYHRHTIGQPIPNVDLNGWLNIMKRGDRVQNHNHDLRSKSYLSGNFIVSCNNTKTVYNNPYQQYIKENELLEWVEKGYEDNTFYASKNTDGMLTLFPSYIPHFTTEHRFDTHRITIAFDLKWI